MQTESVDSPHTLSRQDRPSPLAPWILPGGHRRPVAVGLLALLVAAVAVMVYATGGIKYVYSHAMYLPILVAALCFRWKGALIAAVAGGLLLGPFMPIDTSTGELQRTMNWLIRMGMFAATGGAAGLGVEALIRMLQKEAWLASHDPHTGLSNVYGLERKMRGERENGTGGAICCIVVEAVNLPGIVSSLGHEWADRVMLRLAGSLRKREPSVMAVARYQTAKLGLLIEGVRASSLEPMLRRLFGGEPFTCSWGEMKVYIEARAGVVLDSEAVSSEPEDLLRRADSALEQATSSGQIYRVYDQKYDTQNRASVELLGQLKQAIRNDQLRLYFQPKISTSSLKTVGFEALIRWEHPERGLVPPGLFIPQTEQTSLIDDLTDWIVAHTLTYLNRWTAEGYDLVVSLNVSARNLQAPDFKARLEHHLTSTGSDPSHLELEITESAIMYEPEKVAALLEDVRGLNLLLSIDDFGTGYSSLAYLGMLPVSTIKIDQHFVRPLDHDDQAAAIIRAAVGLARDFGMKTVAEGVENASALDRITALGVDQGQGYHFSKPLPADEVPGWLASSGWPGARFGEDDESHSLKR